MKIFRFNAGKWNHTGLLDQVGSQLEKCELAQQLETEEQIEKLLNSLNKEMSNEMPEV